TFTLGATRWPDGFAIPDAFPLPVVEPTPLDDGSGRVAWVWPLPFDVPATEQRFAPPQMTVHLGDAPIAYDISPYAPGHSGWRLKADALHVGGDARHGARGGTLRHPALAAAIRRLDPKGSGLSPEAFARFTSTQHGETRPGLLLPAPSSASLSLTLPAGARFRAWPDLVSVPIDAIASDGADAILEIEADGRTRVAARVTITHGGVARWSPFRTLEPSPTWEVDLSRWAGRQVTLHLRT